MLHPLGPLVLLLFPLQTAPLAEASAPWGPLDAFRARREAEALAENRDWEAAAALWERLVVPYARDGEAWTALAIARAALEDGAGAAAALERALELGVTNAPSLYVGLARLRAGEGQAEDALAALEQALAARLEEPQRLATDSRLEPLHELPRWPSLVGARPGTELDRVAGWRFDLAYLVTEARRLHAGPERPAWSEAFAAGAASLRDAIPELTDDEVLVRLMGLTARLEDGHSVVYGPGADGPVAFEQRVLPFKFYLFPDGLWIVDGAEAWRDFAGQRVVRFGSVRSEVALERMSRLRGVDNAMTWTWMGPQFYVRQLLLLRAAGVETDGGLVEVELEDLDGEREVLEVEAGEFALVRKLRPSPAALGDVPRYLQRVDTNTWMEPLPDHDALYVQFNQVQDAPTESLAAFAERLREALAEGGPRRLVVDVRHNNGGNNSRLRPLVHALIEFDVRSPENRIVILMGRNTFSACQNFLNRVERWTDALFVGEPSSSCPNFTGEEADLVLPWSRVRFSISSRYWQDSDPGDERPWIAPDVPVELTAQDYFENRDPALEAALALLDEY